MQFFDKSNIHISDDLSCLMDSIEYFYDAGLLSLKKELNSINSSVAEFRSRQSFLKLKTVAQIAEMMKLLSWEDQIICCACSKYSKILLMHLDDEQKAAVKLMK